MDNKQLLANLLAQPGKVGPEHVSMLKALALQYPYAQPIHLLLAKADAGLIPKAALHSHGNTLYHVLNMVAVKDEVESEILHEKEPATLKTDEEVILRAEEDHQETEPVAEESLEDLPGDENQLLDLPVEKDSFIESAASIDFFAFEEKIDEITAAPFIETVVPDDSENNFISKYDDDKLPYTFLWWLARTRKEHEQVFQPYVQQRQPAPHKPAPPQERAEFQQQYVEHIFHIQTPFEVADHLAEYPSAEVKDVKGAEIIEKFLKEDPTIKPPKPELIDNENKAKKSAEDHYDLVSETLAKIYIEQMLYHKAIDTYKKLSLKYPEKSGYFADLIQSIEKKF